MDKKARNAYLEQFFLGLHDRLRVIALAYLDEYFAEDAIQETFVIACKRFDKLSSSPNPQGWIVNTLLNVIKKVQRARFRWGKRTVPIVDEYEDREQTDASEVNAYIHSNEDDYPFEIEDACVREVGEEAYILYKELYLMGLPIEDVASEHGLTIDACRNRAYRTKQKLRKFFEKIFSDRDF